MEVDEVFEIDSTDPKKTTDAIPDEIWNMFPSKGTYLKNIIKFSGYETIDSVLKLKSKDEIEKMFSFVKTMADIVEEKDAMFGIFSKCPEKVMLLPGLEVRIFLYIFFINVIRGKTRKNTLERAVPGDLLYIISFFFSYVIDENT